MRALYEQGAGLDPERDTVAYCRIGERSSHTWFVLHELLGQDNVKNYDGSWTEYGSLVGVPVALGELLVGPVGEGVRPGAEEVNPELGGSRADDRQRLAQVGDGLAHGVADSGDDLDRVAQQLLVQALEELVAELKRKDEPVHEAVASKGNGVFDTLKSVAKQVLTELRKS